MATLREHRETKTRQYMVIMEAWVAGATIEFKGPGTDWMDVMYPSWDWANIEYRIKVQP